MSEPAPAPSLLEAVEVMDRLRSPGGCPWDAEQTHESLAPYLLEESYETLEAIELGDAAHLREELGDLLLQVLFHARIAEENPPQTRFSIEDVAAGIVAKLKRRHPHVFAAAEGADPLSPEQVDRSWDEIKKAEKQRSSVIDGVPMGQPALALSAALVARARRAGIAALVPPGAELGDRLFALVVEAVEAGVDPEAALRARARAYAQEIRVAETIRP